MKVREHSCNVKWRIMQDRHNAGEKGERGKERECRRQQKMQMENKGNGNTGRVMLMENKGNSNTGMCEGTVTQSVHTKLHVLHEKADTK